MGNKGIYTAVSGAKAQALKLDTIANNLANAKTPGFKEDRQLFQEYLTTYERQPGVLEVPKVPASINSFYPLNGGDKSFVDSAGTTTIFSQGPLKLTDNRMDIGIEGDAFFQIKTPAGIRFSRNGQFTRSPEGILVTKDGHPVLMEDQGGASIEDRYVRLDDKRQFTVTRKGDVFFGSQNIGRLDLKTVTEKDALHKEGNSFYTIRENFDNQIISASKFNLHQGTFEQSNVNVVNEMTEMIKTTRLFESAQKAIQAFDSMNGKLINDVGRFR